MIWVAAESSVNVTLLPLLMAIDDCRKFVLPLCTVAFPLGNFARLFYTLAVRASAAAGQAGDGLRRWGALDLAAGRGTLSGSGADRGPLAFARACMRGGAGSLWTQYPRRDRLGQASLFVAGPRRNRDPRQIH